MLVARRKHREQHLIVSRALVCWNHLIMWLGRNNHEESIIPCPGTTKEELDAVELMFGLSLPLAFRALWYHEAWLRSRCFVFDELTSTTLLLTVPQCFKEGNDHTL
jgi:hypothetical protein